MNNLDSRVATTILHFLLVVGLIYISVFRRISVVTVVSGFDYGVYDTNQMNNHTHDSKAKRR